jgi:hypothetical protein
MFANGEESRRAGALNALRHLIEEGGRTDDWDFSINIERAKKDGHPDIAWLPKLAGVINDQEDPAVLDAWKAWQNA